MDDIKIDLTKFTGSSYPVWKFKMKMFLIQRGCWKAVTGEETSIGINQKELAYIGMSIQEVVCVQDVSIAKEAWDSLSAVYDNPGTASKKVSTGATDDC